MIDSHCHLSDARVFTHAGSLIQEALRVDVQKLVIGGVEPDEWRRQRALKKQFPKNLVLNFGLHPWWVEKFSREELETAMEVLQREIVFADGLGETGLDFYSKRDASRFEDQREFFRSQIRIAKANAKPLILHVVQAHEECIQILKEEKIGDHPIALHSYSGNATQALEYLKLNAYFSFSGTLMRAIAGDGHEKVLKAFQTVPLDRVFFETDSPDQGWDQQPNAPARVVEIYRQCATAMGKDPLVLRERIQQNFSNFYGCPATF